MGRILILALPGHMVIVINNLLERVIFGREVRRMIKKLATIGAAAALFATTAMPAFAAPSDCGATHGAFANVNGNFGFLGARSRSVDLRWHCINYQAVLAPHQKKC